MCDFEVKIEVKYSTDVKMTRAGMLRGNNLGEF